ncbi:MULTISPECIES: ion channel [Halomonas]|uniref:Ion transporter n=1 Tax=Halomonas halophila TaxID=29573 RepID=A0ABQ0U1I9_9GAMM|nr:MULTISPECIES: ion channel [Halomonas]MDR5888119.1 ion channel [Halomonas salina]RAH37360.1 two pore domain potassium channel family protein [Halomonas sp. SL1]WJY08640.1 ion channel [Halomonas halophila]GEK72275.1 ion transporter [Halomonas halophila]
MIEPMLDSDHLLVASTTLVVVAACVLLHFEASSVLSRMMRRTSPSRRRRFLGLMYGLLAAHVLEIWLFGLAAWWLTAATAGTVAGTTPMENGLDYVYLSAITFTTLGYGDVFPEGPLRFLMGTESLTGFMLITWSASLTFLEMQRHWNDRG